MPLAAKWMGLQLVIPSKVRERQIYDITYMWNLEKRFKWAYLQNRNRVTDVKKIIYGYQGEKAGEG